MVSRKAISEDFYPLEFMNLGESFYKFLIVTLPQKYLLSRYSTIRDVIEGSWELYSQGKGHD